MSLVENSPLYSLPLIVTSVQQEIQSFGDHVNTARGRTLERLEELPSDDLCNYEVYSILDNRIIYAWCFNIFFILDILDNFLFNIFCCNRCFDKKFGELVKPHLPAPTSNFSTTFCVSTTNSWFSSLTRIYMNTMSSKEL